MQASRRWFVVAALLAGSALGVPWGSTPPVDAGQPRLAFTGIVEDGGEELEALAAVSDPQGDPLTVTVEVAGPPDASSVPNLLLHADDFCNPAYSLPLGGASGEGVVYFADGDVRVLADVDSGAGCVDFLPDYGIARGPCDAPTSPFEGSLDLNTLTLPAKI
jgi:hypothetical protein